MRKNKLFWLLLGLCILFIILRLPSLIEPYWYGDEGIYQIIGKALNNGYILYKDIWDNKPPLLYVIYALANGDQLLVRTFSLIVGTFSVVLFYLLSQTLLKSNKAVLFATGVYVLLFGSPIIEGNIANAENFMLLPIIAAALLIFKKTEQKRNSRHFSFPIAGFLLGIAFLFKTVAIFDFAAFALFVVLLSIQRLQMKFLINEVLKILPLIFGFLIPFLLSMVYFGLHGILLEYMQSIFSRNVAYVGFENYLFGIPQGLLYLKLILLTVALTLIVWKRKLFSIPVLFITLWLTFSLFNANFSGRPYTHYLLVMLPSFCLLIGLAVENRRSKSAALGVMAIIAPILITFPIYGIGKSAAYYLNSLQFLLGQKDAYAYQSFFDIKTPRDYALASFLKNRTTKKDKVLIWGDSAQIYALADKLPPYKYTVAYHVKENEQLLNETQRAIDTAKPKYIVVLPETQPLPFHVPLYIMRFNVEGAIVYERSI